MLDAPISVKRHTAPLVWTTVKKAGKEFNVQVQLCVQCLGEEIAKQIDAMGDQHSMKASSGGLVINLVRRS